MIVIFSAREALYMFPLDWQKPLVLILTVCKIPSQIRLKRILLQKSFQGSCFEAWVCIGGSLGAVESNTSFEAPAFL